MTRDWRYAFCGLILVGILVGSIFLIRSRLPKTSSLKVNSARSQGPVNAPIQIIEYSDFQCPACQFAQPTLLSLLSERQGKIRLIYQHFPLEGHRWSRLAHQSAECASVQNQFWGFHDRLYANQTDWSASVEAPLEQFMRYAKEVNLDLDIFAHCIAESRINKKIEEERLSGLGLGVKMTPSFFVNGELVVGSDALRKKVDELIKK